MGSYFSKKPGEETPPPFLINTNSQYTTELNSYETACQLDPDLQTFDTTLQERTNRVINTLAVGVDVRSLSFDSLREVTGCLLEMNQEVVNVILECKKDIWNNQELFSLVEEYLNSSIQTLDFCTELENCLRRARDSQLILQVAIRQFEEEEKEDGFDGKKYLRTLQELNNFKAGGDPFTQGFFLLFDSVYKQQVSMLQKLQVRKRKLDKRLKSVKAWRTVSNVIFISVFASVLICSVVVAAIAAPPVITALAGALAVPVGSMGKWVSSLWTGYENALKGQREIVSSMQIGTYIAINDLDNIRVLVQKLQIEIGSLLNNANFALREEDAVKLVIDEIKKKLGVFMETIEKLSKQADKCSREIQMARTVILRRIINHPGN